MATWQKVMSGSTENNELIGYRNEAGELYTPIYSHTNEGRTIIGFQAPNGNQIGAKSTGSTENPEMVPASVASFNQVDLTGPSRANVDAMWASGALAPNHYGDPRTNAAAMVEFLGHYGGMDPAQQYEYLISKGIAPQTAAEVRDYGQAVVQAQKDSSKHWYSGLGEQLTMMGKPLAIMGAAAATGGALNGLYGAGAASASGGASIAGGSAGTAAGIGGSGVSGGALGSGITAGSSASGLGGGALGTGLTAGTTTGGIGGGALGSGVAAGGSLAGAGALAPGFFAAESLYPVMGGSSMAGLGGASGGATGGAASSALGGLGSSLLSNPGLIGAGLGALAGGLGGAKPAGETTSTTAPWGPLQPYLTSLFPGAAQTASDTMSGKYLTPQSNPYLAQYGQFLSDQIGANVDSRFSAAGRYGSGSHAGEVARQVGGTLSGLYGNAYSQERGFQNQTANGLLGGNYGGTKTEPYFQNKVGDMFSGALTGYGLSKMFS